MATNYAWLDSAALAAFSALLMGLLKPLIEKVLKPSDPAHDGALRALLYVVNFAGILLLAASANALVWANWPTYVLLALAQTAGAHVLYAVVKPAAPAK